MIFVGGAPRSGTTLVQNMLDSHPEIFGGPEFHHLEAIASLRRRMHAAAGQGWTSDYHAAGDIDRAIARLIEALMLPLADRHGSALISEKTPGNVLVFDDLLDLYPQARCIHVVRDPRAVIASMLQVGKRAARRQVVLQPYTRDVRAAVAYVKACMQAGWRAASRQPDRVMCVTYEDVVSQPAEQTSRLCGFLALPWHPHMVRPADQDHPGEVAMTQTNNDIWYDRQSFRRNPDPAGLDKWTQDLTRWQRAYVVRAFADFEPAHALGYTMEPGTVSSMDRSIALAYDTLNIARRVFRSVRRLVN